jgi:hypothetical protein
MVAKKTTGARKAPPRNRQAVEVASRLIEGVPSGALIAQAISLGEKLYVDTDSEESGPSIIPALIANAQKPEDLFGGSDLEKVENHYGETLRVLGINGVNNSDFKDGLGIYLVLTVATTDGETFALGVGSADAVAKLCALNDMDAFPYDVAFVLSEKPTKRGFYPVNMVSRQVDLF